MGTRGTASDRLVIGNNRQLHGARWLIRWPSSVARFADRHGACQNGASRADVALLVSLEAGRCGRVTMQAWREVGGRRETIIPEREVDATISFDGRLVHADVVDNRLDPGDQRLLAISLDPVRKQLVFAQTTLLITAGFGAGAVDPPKLDAFELGQSEPEAASA